MNVATNIEIKVTRLNSTKEYFNWTYEKALETCGKGNKNTIPQYWNDNNLLVSIPHVSFFLVFAVHEGAIN